MAEQVEQVCIHCGTKFLVDATRLKHGRGKMCSSACHYASKRKRVTINCRQCQQPFTIKESDQRYRISQGTPPQYCSRACAHQSPEWKRNLGKSLRESKKAQAARKRMIEAARRSPGRSDKVKKVWADPEKRARIMAGIKRRSWNPAWKNAPHFRCGPDNPRYKGNRTERGQAMNRCRYKAWRNAVYRRDNWTCQHCFQTGERLNAHHILPWAKFPQFRYMVSNGLTLCESCHDKLHHT